MGKKQDLGEFDFDDLDSFDFDDGDFDQAPPKADRSPVTRATGVVGKAGKQLVKDKQFIRDALRSALPKGYLETFDAADSLKEKAGSLYNEALGEIAPGMRDFKRATKAVLPKVDTWLPKGVAKKLKDWSDQADDDSQAYSQARQDRQELAGSLAEIFDTKAEQDEALAKQQTVERLLLDKKADKRNQSQIRVLSGIQEHTARITSYQDQVLSKFHRKTLELQYLQYFAQRDLLETTKRNNAALLTNVAEIVKNTGLPDYLKINLTEDAKKFMRQKMFGNVLDKSGFSEWSGRFSERLFQNMRSKMKDAAQGFNEAASNASQGAEMLSMVDDLDPEERQALGDEAKASGIATILSFAGAGRWLGNKVGKRFKQNEAINRRGAQLSNAVQGWRTHLTDWAASDTDFENPAYELIDALKGSIGGFGGMKTKINQPSMEKDHLPTPFDGRAHRSLTEVIPGLLSRILQSSESMRTGQPVDLVVYNYDRGQFTSKTRAAKDAMHSIAGKHREDFTARVGELINNIDPDQTLSKAARNLLKLTLIQDVAKSGNGFTPRAYSKPSKFKGAEPEVAKELANHISRTYGVTEDPISTATGFDPFGDEEGMIGGTKRRIKESFGTVARGFGGTTDQIERRTRDAALFDNIRAYAPELGKSLSSYANSGQKDLLYALGVLKKDGTADVVDEDFLWRYLGEAGGDTLTGLEEGENETRNQSSLAGRKVGDRSRTRRPRKPLVAPMGSPVAAPQAPQAVARQSVEADTDRLIEALLKVDPNERLNETNQILAQLLYTVDQIGRGIAPSGNGMGAGAGTTQKRSWWDVRRLAGGATAGARWGAGKAFSLATAPARGAWWGAKKAASGVSGAWGWGKRKLRDYAFDIYVKGEHAPALTRKGMEAKQYVDVNTKKLVRTIKDITGPVMDLTTNSIVLTEDDIKERGLVNAVGKAVKAKGLSLFGKAKDLIGTGIRGYTNLTLSPARLLKNTVKRAWNLSRNWYDIYVEGEAKPRLTAWKLRAGEYFDEHGKVLKSIDEIKGAVYDATGNVVMAADDFKKGLRDQYGRKVRSLLSRGLEAGGRLAGRAMSFAKRNVMRAVRGLGRLAMSPLRGLRALGRGFANGFKAHIKFGATDNDTMQTELLGGIYELLNQRLGGRQKSKFDVSGDGERDGSWRSIIKERLAKRKEEEETKRLAAGKEPKSKPTTMWGRLLAMIGGAGLYLKSLVDKVTSVGGILKSGFTTLFEFFAKKKALDTATDIAGDLAGSGKGKGGLFKRGAKALGKGAWSATKFLGKGAWWAVRGAGTIASIVGGFAARGALALFGPVGLAIAGAATLAYGGYKLYRWLKERLKDLGYLRMAQYGFMEADDAYVQKIRKLEGGIQDYVKDNNGQPQLDPKTPWQDILSDIGVDPENRDQLDQFIQWMQNRFVPVYMAHRKALQQFDPSETVPTEDSAKDAAKLSIARQVIADVPASALQFAQHPFVMNVQLSDRKDEIQRRLAALEQAYGGKERPSTGSGVLEVKRGGSIDSSNGTARSQYSQPSSEIKSVKKATDVVMIDEAVAERERKTAMKAGNFVWGGATAKTIDPLASVRMRAYGLVEMEVSDVAALTGLEQAVIKDVKTGFFGGRSIEGDPAVYYGKFAAVFGCAPTDETQKQKWTYWFTNRFVPVLLTLHEAFSKVSSRVTIENAWQVLSPTDQLLVAQAVVSATAVINGRELSIWAVDASPFVGKPANLDAKSCDVAIDGLKEKIKDRKVQETANSQKRNQEQKKYGIGTNGPGYYGTGSSALTQGNGYYGMGGPGNTAQGSYGGQGGSDPSAANYVPAAGFDHPGAGSGGDINALPTPKGNGFNNVWPLLQEVAKMVGVDPQLLATMCAVESDFKISAKAGTSSAGGLFQFIDDTWTYMLKKYGSKYGIAGNASKNDPRANALMGAEYIRENYEYLAKRIGRKPNANDMYMAHFLGPGGATQVLTGAPDAIAANLNPKAAKSNPTVFYQNKGQGAPRTVRELQAEIDRRMQSKSGAYDIATAAQSATGAAASVPEKPVDPATMPPAAPAAPVKDDPTAIHDVKGGTTSAGGGLGNIAAGGSTTTSAAPSTPSPMTPNTPNASASAPRAAAPSNAGAQQLDRARKEAEMARAQQAAQQQQRTVAQQAATQASSDLANQQLSRLVSIDQTLAKIYDAVASLGSGQSTKAGSDSKGPGAGGNPEIRADNRRSPVAMGSK